MRYCRSAASTGRTVRLRGGAPGVAGELLLRADEPYAFATGYFGMPEKTVEAWRNLWFHTGEALTDPRHQPSSAITGLRSAKGPFQYG